jgi:hypothetical protein
MRCAVFFFVLAANVSIAQQPLFRVVDLDVSTTERVQFADGKSVTVKLLSTSETRDRVRSAIREARADVEINGTRATLSCGNYHLPVALGGAQVDCEVTKAYYRDTNDDHWALAKDARRHLQRDPQDHRRAGRHGLRFRDSQCARSATSGADAPVASGGILADY